MRREAEEGKAGRRKGGDGESSSVRFSPSAFVLQEGEGEDATKIEIMNLLLVLVEWVLPWKMGDGCEEEEANSARQVPSS